MVSAETPSPWLDVPARPAERESVRDMGLGGGPGEVFPTPGIIGKFT
jgi:hypothetical protein